MSRQPTYSVVIVTWNSADDVVACLESLFRAEPLPDQVVVCDNASGDGTLGRIVDWAAGNRVCELEPTNPLHALVSPPVRKPIRHVVLTAARAASTSAIEVADAPLVLIDSGDNLGFAGGSNVGIRFLLERGGDSPIWLLNPDTIVDPRAPRELLNALVSDGVAICGCTVRYLEEPDRIEALGGAHHSWWLAYPRHIGDGHDAGEPIEKAEVLSRMSYVYGASMMLTREFIRTVGLLDEGYFLFFEELDLAMRAKERGFNLGYAERAIVYHRGSGSVAREGFRSATADYFFLRNRIRITRKYKPVALPSVYLAVAGSLAKRALRGQWRHSGSLAKRLISA